MRQRVDALLRRCDPSSASDKTKTRGAMSGIGGFDCCALGDCRRLSQHNPPKADVSSSSALKGRYQAFLFSNLFGFPPAACGRGL
jgi:hypothetical protein